MLGKKALVVPFDPLAKNAGISIIRDIKHHFPRIEVLFMGSASLEIAGQNDIDIYALSKPKDFEKYLPTFKKLFGVPKRIRKTFIEWNFDKNGYSVELFLTVPPRKQIKIFQILKSNEGLRKEYEKLKIEYNGKDLGSYTKAKHNFQLKILLDRN